MYLEMIKMLKSDRKNITNNTAGIPNAVIINKVYLIGMDLKDSKK